MSKTVVDVVVILSLLLNKIKCLDNATLFGVDFPTHTTQSMTFDGAIGPGCGYDYTNKLIYMFGGVLDSFGTINPNYATWDIGSNEAALKNTNNYTTITSPAFTKTFFASNILITIPGYTELSGKWYCFQSDCTVQINQDPYVYIVSPVVFSGNSQIATPSMAIFDMSTQEYIDPSRYTYTIPGGGKTDACIATDGTSLYVIGGQAGIVSPYYSTIYKYTPSSSFISNSPDDIWEFMGDMRYPFSKRGCTTEKISRARYLYMFGGANSDGFGYTGAEYIDLQEYATSGFNESYYDMGAIIDRTFKLLDPQDWYALNCFPSQYAQDIIYCGGGFLKPEQAGGIQRNAQIWLFERVYQFNLYALESTLTGDPLYSCTKKSNNFGPPYLQYPDCAGYVGYQVGELLARGYPQSMDTTTAPRTFVSGCVTPWIEMEDSQDSLNNFGLIFYLGGYVSTSVNAQNAIVIREDNEAFFYTSNPTPGPTLTPSTNPTVVPSLAPSLVTSAPVPGQTQPPPTTRSPTVPGETFPPTGSPLATAPAETKGGLTQTQIIIIACSVAGGIILIVIITLIICKCKGSTKSGHGFSTDDDRL